MLLKRPGIAYYSSARDRSVLLCYEQLVASFTDNTLCRTLQHTTTQHYSIYQTLTDHMMEQRREY